MARILGILALILVIGGAAIAKTIPEYDGEPVTAIVVHKEARKMFLMHNDTVLRSYTIGLGFAPDGHKEIEGDGKTPEGRYVIDRKNPNSKFHLSLGISYPNDADRSYAKASANRQAAISLSTEIRISNTASNVIGATFLTTIGPQGALL